MPVVIAWLGEMLLSVIGQLAISALVSVGIGFASSSIASYVNLGGNIKTAMAGAGPLYAYIGFFRIDTAITIVLSAWAGRMITSAARVHFTANKTPTKA
jgi:hypothetical protein